MPRASETDALLDRIYECLLAPEGWPGTLDAYARLVGGDSAIVFVRPTGTAGTVLTSHRVGSPYRLDRYLSYYESRSPLLGRFRRLPAGRFGAVGQFAFSPAYRETEFFQDWVRPQGFGDMLGAHLLRTRSLYSWMSIRRTDDRGPFSAEEIRTANSLAGHLGRAMGLGSRLERERRVAADTRSLLDLLDFGVLIVDASARVLSANSTAEALLRAGDGIQSQYGCAVCRRADDTLLLHAAIAAVASHGGTDWPRPTTLAVTRERAPRPLTAHVVPMPSNPAWQQVAPSSAAAAVFMVDPLATGPRTEALRLAYGLTDAEIRVVREIVGGSGLVEAALGLGLATPTARTHLQHVFEKTGVNSQAQLVRLVLASSPPS